jgi:hypothetical protein
MSKEDKKKGENDKGSEGEKKEKTVEMVWIHKKVKPGDIDTVFGWEGIGNDDGFLVVEMPESQVNNEMKRVTSLIPLDIYEKRKDLEREAKALYK